MKRLFFLWLFLALCFSISPIEADEIHLREGRVIEGKILEKNSKHLIVLVTKSSYQARLTIPRSKVLKIVEKKKTTFEKEVRQFHQRWKKLKGSKNPEDFISLAQWARDRELSREAQKAILRAYHLKKKGAKSASEWYQLSLWLKEHNLNQKAKRALKQVLALDGNHEMARRDLGFVRIFGKWVKREEVKSYKEEYFRSRGYVRYRGEWVKPKVAKVMKKLEEEKEKKEKKTPPKVVKKKKEAKKSRDKREKLIGLYPDSYYRQGSYWIYYRGYYYPRHNYNSRYYYRPVYRNGRYYYWNWWRFKHHQYHKLKRKLKKRRH